MSDSDPKSTESDLGPVAGKENHSGWIVAAVLVIVYVLAPGPLTWMDQKGWIDGGFKSVLQVVFHPLRLLYEQVPVVQEFYRWWIGIFE